MARRLLAAAALALAGTAAAQSYDPRYRWQTLETPHFQLHFHQGEEALARRAAGAAERAHALLSPLLRYDPPGKTQIVLSDDSDDSNGSATPLPYNTIRLYAAPPPDLSQLNDYADWLYSLVAHEYVHILHLDTVEGFPRIFNGIFGKLWVPNGLSPPWLVEGLATLHESSPGHGRNSSALFDMYARALATEGGIFPLDDVSNPLLQWPLGSTWYLLGGRFWAFLQERYGPAAVADFVHDQGGWVWPYALGTVAERHFGDRSFLELWGDFAGALAERYREQLAEVRRRPVTAAERLTRRGAQVAHPRWSPDGAWVAFYDSGLDGLAGLRRVGRGGEDLGFAVRVDADGTFALRGARQALVAITDYFEEFRFYGDLYLVDLETGSKERITYGERATRPDLGRDRETVAYVAHSAPGELSLRRLRLDARAPETLFHLAGAQIYAPRLSPDGKRIAFELQIGKRRDIAVWENGTVVRITDDDAIDTGPAWSPDGARLYFSSDRGGVYNLYAWEAEPGTPAAKEPGVPPVAPGRVRQVTNVETGAFEPDPSPDGRTLVFVTYSRAGYDLATLPVDPDRWLEASPAGTRPSGVEYEPAADAEVHPYRPLQTLLPTYWLPAPGYDAAGFTLGALTGGRDVIGLHSWSLTVNWSFEGHEVGYDAAYLASWLYPQILVGSRRYLADAPYDSSRLEIRWTPGEIRFLFPFRHTERSLLLSPGWRGTLYSPRDPLPFPTTPQEQGFRSEVTFSLAYSDARRFVNSISLEEGRTVTFDAAVASKAFGSDYAFALGRVALDQYFRVPFTRHWVLALHLAAGAAAGTMRGLEPFELGGIPRPSLFGLLLAAAGLGGAGAIPDELRGYPSGQFAGSRLVSGTLELRFPIAAPQWGYSTWPVFLRRLSGAAFLDSGIAYTPGFPSAPGEADVSWWQRLRFGTGIELRLEVVLGYYITLDLRLGVARGLGALLYPGANPADPSAEWQVYLTLGQSF